jgi:hypothetical protein
MLQQWFGIFRPEDNKTRIGVRNIAFQAVEGICPRRVTNFQPMEKPVGIEGWYVGASAGGNDYRELGISQFSIFAVYFVFAPLCHSIYFT